MKCVNHPEVDAVGACVGCGKGLCAECKREIGIKLYCRTCARERLSQKAAPSTTATYGDKRGTSSSYLPHIDKHDETNEAHRAFLRFGVLGFIFHIFKNRTSDGTSKLSIAALICGFLSFTCFWIVFFVDIFLFVIPDTYSIAGTFGNIGFGITITLAILAVIFGGTTLLSHPNKQMHRIAIAGILLGTIPLCIIVISYIF